MKTFLILLFTIIIFSSCEKNINFNLKNADDVLVVDAQIENGQAPIVVLTKSFDYFSTINPQLLNNSFVRNATVTVSNGTLTHQLKEYTFPLGGGYTAYYYSVDPASPATSFIGEFNKNLPARFASIHHDIGIRQRNNHTSRAIVTAPEVNVLDH